MKSSSIWFAAIGCLVIAGCESGISLDDLPAKTAQAYCSKVYECCTPTDLPDASSFGPAHATCVTNVTQSQTNLRNQIEAAEKANRVVYHGDRLAQCLS